jgi:isopentenyl-diphosphate delta-isomerase
MITDRKIEHLMLCSEEEVESGKTGFDDINLIHKALPEISKAEIDVKTTFLGRVLRAPIFIAGMTGGHRDTIKVNAALAQSAENLGIGMGVGSQRAAVEHPEQEASFKIVRDLAPNAFIVANIGIPQVKTYDLKVIENIIHMIQADALAIHLNFLQEAIQPEGETDAKGCLDAIDGVCNSVTVPVIVKETGAGISKEIAEMLKNTGVSAIDVGGRGGTTWAGVESFRASESRVSKRLGTTYWHWGIPTPISILESRILPTIATGGIRNGLHVAKSLALGASLCGMALPLVKPALQGHEKVTEELKTVIEEFKIAMFLTGCKKPVDLVRIPITITGETKQILEQREFNVYEIVKRRY